MTSAIMPSAPALLRSVRETLITSVLPAVAEIGPRSALTTIDHVLRHVEARIEHEGQILSDEIRYLDPLLQDATPWLLDRNAGPLVDEIRSLAQSRRDPDIYLSLAILAEEIGQRRGIVHKILAMLNAPHPARADAAAEALHGQLRDYLAWQINQESALIEPAFRGHGPRR